MHLPHFVQVKEGLPFSISFESIDKVGHVLAHNLQLVHLSLSIRNPKILILLVNDNNEPIGQKVEH